MHIYLIFLETTMTGLYFSADNIGLSSLKFFWWAQKLLFVLASGAFWPFNVIQGRWFGANRKRICDFLLVHNNLGPILHVSDRVFNPGPVFSIPGFGIGGFLIPGSRRYDIKNRYYWVYMGSIYGLILLNFRVFFVTASQAYASTLILCKVT